MNWVEAEVDLALSRANTKKPSPLLFIPALARESKGSSVLPPFAKRYQGVRDPLGDGEEFGKLVKALLDAKWDASVRRIDEPFVGLRSMREEEADRFFGRDAEVKELAEKFRKHRLVAIVADSGTGKSSLAEAGFAAKFRGGALAEFSRSEPDDRVWHVISMRPGTNPEEGLKTGVSEAAQKLGLSVGDQSSLRKLIAVGDPSETAFGLQCNLPPKRTATLLIVDQFEELLTQTPDALAAPFARLMLALADSDKDIRILLTVRADYFNLVSAIKDDAGQPVKGADGKTLFERLTNNGRAAILPLKRIAEGGPERRHPQAAAPCGTHRRRGAGCAREGDSARHFRPAERSAAPSGRAPRSLARTSGGARLSGFHCYADIEQFTAQPETELLRSRIMAQIVDRSLEGRIERTGFVAMKRAGDRWGGAAFPGRSRNESRVQRAVVAGRPC